MNVRRDSNILGALMMRQLQLACMLALEVLAVSLFDWNKRNRMVADRNRNAGGKHFKCMLDYLMMKAATHLTFNERCRHQPSGENKDAQKRSS